MNRRRSRPPCKPPRAAALVAALSLLVAARALAAGELIKNGAFSEGDGDRPTGWSTEMWAKAPGTTTFSWARGNDGIGTVTIDSQKPNDAAWIQSVGVSPQTWYRVSAWVRSEDVGDQHLGAYLSVMDTFFNSPELRGTQPWQSVSLWVKTKPLETSLRIGLRLGGYSSLNTGRASFALVSVEAAGTPPHGAANVYGNVDDAPSGRLPWVQGIAVLVVAAIGFVLWRYLARPATGARA